MTRARAWASAPGRRSTSCAVTPREARKAAAESPTMPPPTIRTCTSSSYMYLTPSELTSRLRSSHHVFRARSHHDLVQERADAEPAGQDRAAGQAAENHRRRQVRHAGRQAGAQALGQVDHRVEEG